MLTFQETSSLSSRACPSFQEACQTQNLLEVTVSCLTTLAFQELPSSLNEQFIENRRHLGWKNGSVLRTQNALPEDLSSFPSTHCDGQRNSILYQASTLVSNSCLSLTQVTGRLVPGNPDSLTPHPPEMDSCNHLLVMMTVDFGFCDLLVQTFKNILRSPPLSNLCTADQFLWTKGFKSPSFACFCEAHL